MKPVRKIYIGDSIVIERIKESTALRAGCLWGWTV